MDSINIKIVSALYREGRIATKNLAKNIFLSSPATTARIEKLEQDKVITGYHADADFSKLGLPFTAYILFSLIQEDDQNFKALISNEPHILSCKCAVGPFTHIMEVVFSTSSELGDFVTQLGELGRVQTLLITGELKSYRQADLTQIISDKKS